MQIVLIYDKLLRSDTTGVYCEAAMRSLGLEVFHYDPMVRESADTLRFRRWEGLPQGADLYFQIDDDLAYPAPPVSAPTAYWCIDVHRMERLAGGRLTRWEKLKGFRHVFSAQLDMAKQMGVPWLPLAYDPALARKLPECQKQWDWCCVGKVDTRRRIAALAALRAVLPNGHIGPCAGTDWNRTYNESRLIINLGDTREIERVFFEAQGSGTPLLSGRPGNGEGELFDGVVYFDTIDELIDRSAELLKAPEALESLGQRQLRTVAERHTFVHRMRELLHQCGVAEMKPVTPRIHSEPQLVATPVDNVGRSRITPATPPVRGNGKAPTLMRWDIINHFVRTNQARLYLEIGYFRGWSFDSVRCEEMLAVDPEPCKDESQKALSYGALQQVRDRAFVCKLTSDDFFSKIAGEDIRYDVIFIDGLHQAEQVSKDIENALKHLSPDGVIILHDCNPPTLEHVTTGTAIGEWTGDCYRSVIKYRGSPLVDLYVVDTDWGVGILRPRRLPEPSPLSGEAVERALADWDVFNKNRVELLGLVSVEEFWRMEGTAKRRLVTPAT